MDVTETTTKTNISMIIMKQRIMYRYRLIIIHILMTLFFLPLIYIIHIEKYLYLVFLNV